MTLDELIALNDEIAALVRSGVPLEEGLAELGGDLPGRLGQFAKVLAERTARGESLVEAMADDEQLPSAYRAIIEAGVSRGPPAGRVGGRGDCGPPAVRNLPHHGQRRHLPTDGGAGGVVRLSCFLCAEIAPRLAAMFQAFDMPGQWFFVGLGWAANSAWLWGPIVPAAVLLLAVAWWLGRKKSRWVQQLFKWMPWTGGLFRCWQTATFLEMLALLVENLTPLPEARAFGRPRVGRPRDDAIGRASRRRAGSTAARREPVARRPPGFPPLVSWLLMAAGRERRTAAGLEACSRGLPSSGAAPVRPAATIFADFPDNRRGWNRYGIVCLGTVCSVYNYASCDVGVTFLELGWQLHCHP